MQIQLTVNEEIYSFDVEPSKTLLELLRDDLGLIGVKEACGLGECGACTVILDGKAILSCMTLAVEADGGQVLTIEGLAQDGDLHPIQRAFVDHGAVQCGFCTPGMVLSSKALLDENPSPTEEEIREALVGNICRCTGYTKIIDAVSAAAEMLRAEGVES